MGKRLELDDNTHSLLLVANHSIDKWYPAFSSDAKRFFSTLRENDIIAKRALEWEYMDNSFLTLGYNYRSIDHSFVQLAFETRASGISFDEDKIEEASWDNIFSDQMVEAGAKGQRPSASISKGVPEWYTAKRYQHTPFIEWIHEITAGFSIQLGLRGEYIDEMLSYGINERLNEYPLRLQ